MNQIRAKAKRNWPRGFCEWEAQKKSPYKWIPPPEYPDGSVDWWHHPYIGPLAILPAGFFPQPLADGVGHYVFKEVPPAVVEPEQVEPEPKPPYPSTLRLDRERLEALRTEDALAKAKIDRQLADHFELREFGIDPAPPIDLVPIPRAAEILGISPKKIWKCIRSGGLRYWGRPKHYRVSLAETKLWDLYAQGGSLESEFLLNSVMPERLL